MSKDRSKTSLIQQAGKLKTDERICTGRSKVRDENGEVVRDEHGKALLRPCRQRAIRGGTVCVMHGGRAPQVRRKAERRLLALVEPSIGRLQDLIDQEDHLPTALGAIKEVLNRAGGIPLGPVGEARIGDRDSRPIIQIGIAVGGVKSPEPIVGLLPAVEAEVVDPADE